MWLHTLSWNFTTCNLLSLNFWIRLMLLKTCKKEMGYDLSITSILYKYLHKLCILSFMIKHNFIVIFLFTDNSIHFKFCFRLIACLLACNNYFRFNIFVFQWYWFFLLTIVAHSVRSKSLNEKCYSKCGWFGSLKYCIGWSCVCLLM